MTGFDYEYLCTTIGRLSSVPARVYERRKKVFFFSAMPLKYDPIKKYEENILSLPSPVGYVVTDDFDFYGTVRRGETLLVFGPTRQIPRTGPETRRLAFELGVPKDEVKEFVTSMEAILPLPLDFLLTILCMLHYVFTGEKLELRDLKITDLQEPKSVPVPSEDLSDVEPGNNVDIYNAYRAEREILDIVRSGDVEKLDTWAGSAPPIRAGQTSAETMRQEKNIFTVTATLVSRAAIDGGLEVDDALRLSDSFIRKCELLTSLDSVSKLQLDMVRRYTNEVSYVRECGAVGELAKKVTAYVRRHLSEPIHTEDVARSLYMNRSSLSTKFKAQQGVTLTDFIRNIKIQEAKRLLAHSERSLDSIADYLGFSSQSHFTRVFKAQTGLTPREYREER